MSAACDGRAGADAGAERAAAQAVAVRPGQQRREGLARQHFRWNYAALVFDGGLYVGGIAFVNATALLPDIVRKLHGPKLLIALMPVLGQVGFRLAPALTAHWMDALRRYRATLLGWGLLQRSPYLVAGLVLLLAAGRHEDLLMLAAITLAPLISGIAGGIPSAGFQQVVRKQIPERRRSSLFALRMALGAIIGVGAGGVATAVLDKWPNATGYGVLFVLAFVVLMGSWVSFATIRETPEPRQRRPEQLRLVSNLKRMPGMLMRARAYRAYLVAQFFLNGQFILIPFIAIYARESLHLGQAFLGTLVMVQSAGALAGNALAAWAGDKFGSKRPMTLGALAVLALAVGVCVAHSAAAFLALFGLLGVALALTAVGGQALILGVCPEEDKSTYLSMAGIVNLPAMLAAALAAAVIPAESLEWLALAAGLSMVGCLTALWFVPNPGGRTTG